MGWGLVFRILNTRSEYDKEKEEEKKKKKNNE